MNKSLSKLLGIIVLLLAGVSANAQLAGGTYTINSASPTSGTNYASFTAAVAAMSSGISGAVTFNVTPGSGPYNSQLTIGNITGASATNRIRFNGNGATIQYSPTATYTGILMMNGAKYVKIDSLNFVSQSSIYGFGAILYNACNYDSITRCTFDLTGVSTTSSTNCGGIRITSSATSTSSTLSGATNTYIGHNKVLGTTGAGGPYYGFYFYGPNTNNVYDGNLISNYYYYGFYAYYGANGTYINNRLTRETKTIGTYGYYGLYLYYPTAGSVISGNKIEYLGGSSAGTSYSYPFNIFNGSGTAANPIIVSNNLIGNMTSAPYYGMRLSGSDYMKVYHNTVSIDVPITYTNANYGIYALNCDYVDIKNNNVSITGGSNGVKYGLYYGTNIGIASDYNNVYVNSSQAGTQSYAYSGGARATLSAFQTANPTLEANGLSVDPQYIAPVLGNFTPQNNALIGAGTNLLADVPEDIGGRPRSSNPTPGAFEVLPTISNNVSLASLVTPSGSYCSGNQAVKVTVSNAGTNNITSFQVHWLFNGIAQTPFTYSGTLTPLTSSTGLHSVDVNLGNANLNTGTNTIKLWTSLPNNTTDGDRTNDTLATTLDPATFTVSSNVDTVCTSSPFVVSLSPNTGYTIGGIEWQKSLNGVLWTTIPNTDTVDYATSGLTATTQFRAHIISAGGGCYSPSQTIVVNNPTVLSTTAASRCGIGTLTLQAAASGGAGLSWYDVASGGTALDTGSSFITPTISTTQTFYVSASVGGAQYTGKPTHTSTTGNSGFSDVGLVFNALAPFTIASVDVYPLSTSSTSGSVTIALKNSAGTILQSATSPVTVSSTGALNTIPLNFNVAPGTNYRLLVTAASGMSTLIREVSSGFTFPYNLAGISSITSSYSGAATSSYYYYLYNWRVETGCEGARIPVVASIATAPAINAVATPATICAGTSTTLSVSSTNANYGYSWSSGSTASSFTVSPVTTTTYIVNASDAATNCSAIDSVKVTVIVQTASASPSATQTICIGNTITLTANNGANLSYQWFNSGVLIPGATSRTYAAGDPGVYTVRVTNTVAGCPAFSNGVTVNTVAPPVVSISPSGPTNLCAGDTLILQGQTGTGYTYQWKKGAANAPGASTTATYRTTLAGNYKLVVSANGCSITSSNANVTIAPLPVAQITPSTAAIRCDSVLFSSSTPNATYQWRYNGMPVIGGTSAGYSAKVSGQYSVKVTSTLNGCSAISANVSATVFQSPSGTITYSSPLSFCDGGAVVLNATGTSGITYKWSRNGTAIPGATTSSYIVNTAGLYSLLLKNPITGCNKVAGPVSVTVFPTPVASISYNPAANLLSANGTFAQYQWRVNNQPISGATQATHTPLQNGAYGLSVVDTNGCRTISNIEFVNSLGIANQSAGAGITVYPNPTSSVIHVNAPVKVILQLMDLTGKTMMTNRGGTALDLRELAQGVYLLHVSDIEGRLLKTEKITKIQ